MERRTKLTIVTESIIESMLVEDLARLGARGYTILEARGRGSRGVRTGDWDQNRNIQLEIICDRKTAEAIVEHCTRTYYANYAMILYLSDVEVLRGEKF